MLIILCKLAQESVKMMFEVKYWFVAKHTPVIFSFMISLGNDIHKDAYVLLIVTMLQIDVQSGFFRWWHFLIDTHFNLQS